MFQITPEGRAYIDQLRRPRASTVNPFALALQRKRRQSAPLLSPAA